MTIKPTFFFYLLYLLVTIFHQFTSSIESNMHSIKIKLIFNTVANLSMSSSAAPKDASPSS